MSLRKNSSDHSEKPSRGGSRPDAIADPHAPMSPDQAALLKRLAEQAPDPEAFDETLTMGEAAERIAALEALLESENRGGVVRMPRT